MPRINIIKLNLDEVAKACSRTSRGRLIVRQEIDHSLQTQLEKDIPALFNIESEALLDGEIGRALQRLFHVIARWPECTYKQKINQKIRLMAFALERKLSYLEADSLMKNDLQRILAEIAEVIGIVPRLSHRVQLPTEYYSEEIRGNIEDWKTKPITQPRRGRGKMEVHFIESKSKSTAREDAKVRHPFVMIWENQPRFLNFTDFDFYTFAQMHADHFQPSSELIYRIQEMLMAMNYDRRFAEEIKATGFDDGFFLRMKKRVRSKEAIGSIWLTITVEKISGYCSLQKTQEKAANRILIRSIG